MLQSRDKSQLLEQHMLLLQIEALRQELIELGLEKGLQSSDVIQKSAQLDELLNRYQKLKLNQLK